MYWRIPQTKATQHASIYKLDKHFKNESQNTKRIFFSCQIFRTKTIDCPILSGHFLLYYAILASILYLCVDVMTMDIC